jgi:hypothetical protein
MIKLDVNQLVHQLGVRGIIAILVILGSVLISILTKDPQALGFTVLAFFLLIIPKDF